MRIELVSHQLPLPALPFPPWSCVSTPSVRPYYGIERIPMSSKTCLRNGGSSYSMRPDDQSLGPPIQRQCAAVHAGALRLPQQQIETLLGPKAEQF